ncbi:uncharacterized protein LOC121797278 [Salvia splendens]|uniref:uncharacterized protein LOC121797278 n=1 Tax=Salvia splendens TaxID=180675 RepID=UPI001C276B58|nr:uncharacterized protein LOC121797278 [Salvia splendens]
MWEENLVSLKRFYRGSVCTREALIGAVTFLFSLSSESSLLGFCSIFNCSFDGVLGIKTVAFILLVSLFFSGALGRAEVGRDYKGCKGLLGAGMQSRCPPFSGSAAFGYEDEGVIGAGWALALEKL